MMHKTMMSGGASNLTPADTRSEIAPKLPAPKVGPDAGPEQYLMAAKRALKAKRTGVAQEALEMAETRVLDRATPVDQAGTPDMDPMVTNIHAALDSLGKKDWDGANMAIDKALGGKASSMSMDDKPMHPHHKPMMKKTPADSTSTTPPAAQ
jgi:hypothetical protein